MEEVVETPIDVWVRFVNEFEFNLTNATIPHPYPHLSGVDTSSVLDFPAFVCVSQGYALPDRNVFVSDAPGTDPPNTSDGRGG